MAGQIALVGGDEFRAGCEEMDRAVLRASGREPARVLVIPTAAVTGPQKAANDGATHFAALGAQAEKLMVLDHAQANDAAFIRPAADADVVYFTGGSPAHLLETLRDSALLRLLQSRREQGMVWAGSSAGAMVLGAMMRTPGAGEWVAALGLAPGLAVLPHHERRNPDETLAELAQSAPPGLTYLGIDARTAVLGNPGQWRVEGHGQVTVYRQGQYTIHQPGTALPAGF